jgi:AraC-like DNA-binding protein
MSDSGKVPFSLFTTEHLNLPDQFDAWHDSISVVFDVAPSADRMTEGGFKASVRAYHLGNLFVSQVDFDGQRFTRDRRRVVADGLDHYLVQLYARGGLVGTAGERERVLRAGDVQVLDLSRHNITEAKASGTIAIVVPRDVLREALPKVDDLHGLVLRGDTAIGSLLAEYMRSLVSRANDILLTDAPQIAHGTTTMIAACFHSTAETVARARTQIEMATLERIRRHIADNLGSPRLGPETLCGLFRISRTQLYRLFEPLGGVAAYIQEQRLARAYIQLTNPLYNHNRIFEIAFRWGFGSEAHFSRLFRRTFGLSPSEARERVRTAPYASSSSQSEIDSQGGGYQEWIRRLRQ